MAVRMRAFGVVRRFGMVLARERPGNGDGESIKLGVIH
jgi:hypothetical protein